MQRVLKKRVAFGETHGSQQDHLGKVRVQSDRVLAVA
jgi:hypothetical protein